MDKQLQCERCGITVSDGLALFGYRPRICAGCADDLGIEQVVKLQELWWRECGHPCGTWRAEIVFRRALLS